MPQHTVATLTGDCIGVNTITKLHFMETVANLAERQALAIAVRDRFLDGFKVASAATMIWRSIIISVAEDPNDSPYVLPITVAGQGTGTLLAQQLAIMLHLQTGTAGRKGRGRLFIPGIASGSVSAGLVAGGTQSQLNVVMGNMLARWCAGGSEAFHLAVYSRTGTSAVRPVATMSYNTVLSTLRSRRIGTGV